jgi:hypothetical protein
MIIHINGLPGVGKLTVARALTDLVDGWLVDNHAIYNLAFSLAPFRSTALYDLARAVRDIAYARIAALPDDRHVILTNALTRSPWGNENWRALLDLAERSNRPLMAVTLTCEPGEHRQRMTTPERAYLGKLTDPTLLRLSEDSLLARGARQALSLNVTTTPPKASAAAIVAWVRAPSP